MEVLEKLRVACSKKEILSSKQYLYPRKENVDYFKFSWAATAKFQIVSDLPGQLAIFSCEIGQSPVRNRHDRCSFSSASSQHQEKYLKFSYWHVFRKAISSGSLFYR
jgi:hypothetical protein